VVVSFTGDFNAGKTFLTNLLNGVRLSASETEHTHGISIFTKSEGNILFIDTEGQGNPVTHEIEYVNDRRLTDYFIYQTVQRVSHKHVRVINRMNNEI
jgi:GTPase Era involved in 16S rRNA processing